MMDRRDALKRISLLMGGLVSTSTAAAILGGCRPSPGETPYALQTLSPAETELVATLVDRIIPPTDTPGARAAKVHEFIDLMLTDWNTAAEKEQFLAGLADVEARAMADYGLSFVASTAEEQNRLLTILEEEALAWQDAVAAGAPGSDQMPFFITLKGVTVAGYYTSEIGASQELKFQMVFPAYEGSVPYAQIGRAWS